MGVGAVPVPLGELGELAVGVGVVGEETGPEGGAVVTGGELGEALAVPGMHCE